MNSEPLPPAARLLAQHLRGARFLSGEEEGRWGLAESDSTPESPFPHWPKVMMWVAAASRPNGPDRFHFLLDLSDYPTRAPTAMLCEPGDRSCLSAAKRPKGGDRVQMVFRSDWNNGTALYHPFDRVAAESHGDWPTVHPHKIWNSQRQICDLLLELHTLLHSAEYTNV